MEVRLLYSIALGGVLHVTVASLFYSSISPSSSANSTTTVRAVIDEDAPIVLRCRAQAVPRTGFPWRRSSQRGGLGGARWGSGVDRTGGPVNQELECHVPRAR